MDHSSKLGAAFICVFALPFAGFGLFAFATVIRQVADGAADSKAWLGLIFAFVFTGIGLGLISLVIFGGKELKKQQRTQAEHPAEPWLWREDWAKGRIKGSVRSGMVGAWIFAVIWNLMSAPVLILLPQEVARKPAAYLALIFPVAGVFLLVRAIRMTMAFTEFGVTWFEMAPIPRPKRPPPRR